MDKRSLSIAGHRTSIALEAEFWAGLDAMAAERGQTMATVIRTIDETRDTANLSSAVRLAVLRWYKAKLASSVETKAGSEPARPAGLPVD